MRRGQNQKGGVVKRCGGGVKRGGGGQGVVGCEWPEVKGGWGYWGRGLRIGCWYKVGLGVGLGGGEVRGPKGAGHEGKAVGAGGRVGEL